MLLSLQSGNNFIKKYRNMKKLLLLVAISTIMQLHSENLRIAKIFNDHAIIQRDTEVPIWGWGIPEKTIELSFQNRTYKTKVNNKGEWRIIIPPTSYGGPYTISIKSRNKSIVLNDIYVGDVWVCSGQSNMQFQLSGCFDAEAEISKATDPLIREFRVPQSSSDYPEDDLAGGNWKVGNPENAAGFTAVGYYFAQNIRKEFPGLPIGLVNNAWGGSKIEPYMSAASFQKSQDDILKEIAVIKGETREQQLKMLAYLDKIPEEDAGMINDKPLWAAPNLDDSNWNKMKLPIGWENAGLPNLDGIIWFRKTFKLSHLKDNDSTLLSIGRIDDDAEIWINGNRIDNLFNRSYQYSDLREYKLSNTLFKIGSNTITTRVTDTGGGGGMGGNTNELYVDTGDEKVDISGEWHYKIGEVFLNFIYGPRQKPTTIYNKMVYPINDFKAKGILWYQGESNTNDIVEAQNYENLFKTMILQWRNDRKDENLPFYFVQLASFLPEVLKPKDHSWAHLRWSQYKALELPFTGMASALDIGEANDIHPRNKKDVGERLSRIALHQVYEKSQLSYKNPSYKSHKVEDGKFIITLENTSGNLIVKNKYGYINAFAIAGEDGKFVWANAILKNGNVEVWSPKVKNPKKLRYAWSANALDANLFTSDGIPVVPFKLE